MLASLVLPAQILDYFLISGVEQTSQEIHISLDEKMNPELSNNRVSGFSWLVIFLLSV